LDYLKILVEEIHSTDAKGRISIPNGWNRNTFLFQLSRIKDAFPFSGVERNIGSEKLDEIFEKNPYVQEIYLVGTRSVLEAF
jgi:hypothetical protein